MALILDKQLLIDFNDIKNHALGLETKLNKFSESQQESCLQNVHDFMLLSGDKVYVSDSRFTLAKNRILQKHLGAHFASLMADNSAGTGSLSNKSIDSYSVSFTMARNNAPYNDWLNITQYGTFFLNLTMRVDYSTRFGIA